MAPSSKPKKSRSKPPSLEALAKKINAACKDIDRLSKSKLQRAIECGQWLRQAKAEVNKDGRGEWLRWRDQHIKAASERTCTSFMALAEDHDREPAKFADCRTLGEAMARVSGRKVLADENGEPEAVHINFFKPRAAPARKASVEIKTADQERLANEEKEQQLQALRKDPWFRDRQLEIDADLAEIKRLEAATLVVKQRMEAKQVKLEADLHAALERRLHGPKRITTPIGSTATH